MNANVNTHLSEMLLRTANILMNKDRLFGNLRGAPHQWGRFRRKLAKTPPPVSNTTPNPKEPKLCMDQFANSLVFVAYLS